MAEVKDHIRALARASGLSAKAIVADFIEWRMGERATEAKGSGKG
jgi:hypothetical protein